MLKSRDYLNKYYTIDKLLKILNEVIKEHIKIAKYYVKKAKEKFK